MEALKRLFERSTNRSRNTSGIGVLRFSEVLPDVFVGSCPATLADARRLKAGLGITAVLNLQTDDDFERWNIDWPALQTAYRDLEVAVERVPMIDFDSDDLKVHAPGAANCLARLLEVGHRVYVHCTAGQQRSPATVILFMVSAQGMDLDEAVALMSDKHACEPDVAALRAVLGLQGKPGEGHEDEKD